MRRIVLLPIVFALVAVLAIVPSLAIPTPPSYHITVKFYDAYYTYGHFDEAVPVFEEWAELNGYSVSRAWLWKYKSMYVIYKPTAVNFTIYVWNHSSYPVFEQWYFLGRGADPEYVFTGYASAFEFELPDNGDGWVIVIVNNDIVNMSFLQFPGCCINPDENVTMPMWTVKWIQYYHGKLYEVHDADYSDGEVTYEIAIRHTINPHTLETADDWCWLTRFGDLWLRDV